MILFEPFVQDRISKSSGLQQPIPRALRSILDNTNWAVQVQAEENVISKKKKRCHFCVNNAHGVGYRCKKQSVSYTVHNCKHCNMTTWPKHGESSLVCEVCNS